MVNGRHPPPPRLTIGLATTETSDVRPPQPPGPTSVPVGRGSHFERKGLQRALCINTPDLQETPEGRRLLTETGRRLDRW